MHFSWWVKLGCLYKINHVLMQSEQTVEAKIQRAVARRRYDSSLRLQVHGCFAYEMLDA